MAVSGAITDQQIANAALAGGFPSSQIAMAVAIALAESGGRPTVTHTNTNGSTDYGLWQVNSIHGFPVSELLTVTGNARYAHQVYANAGNSWTPWSTYKNGSYLAFLARGKAVAGSASAGGSVNDPPTNHGGIPDVSVTIPANPLTQLYANLTSFLKFVSDPNSWRRVGLFGLGAILIVIGLIKLTGNNQLSPTTKAVGKAVARTAVKVAVMPK